MAESNRDEIAKLEALYASNPDGRVFTHLAEAYRKAGELDRAREVLDRGLRRHQDYASAHVVLGRVLADQGLAVEAASSFQRVLELDPENLIARRSLAESDRAAGRDAEALVHYRELLAQDPSSEEVRSIVADLEARVEPPAQPSTSAAWAASQAEETWEQPASQPFSLEATSFGGAAEPPEPPSEPVQPLPLEEPISLEGISFGGDSGLEAGSGFDLDAVDFGGNEPAAPEAAIPLTDFGIDTSQDEPEGPREPSEVEPPPTLESLEESGAPGAAAPEMDEQGWGAWPGAAPELPQDVAPEAAQDIAPEAAQDIAPELPQDVAAEPLTIGPVDGLERAAEPEAEAFPPPDEEELPAPPEQMPVAALPEEAEAPPAEEPRAEEPPEALPPATVGDQLWGQAAAVAPSAGDTEAAGVTERAAAEALPGYAEPERRPPTDSGAMGMPTETLAALYRAQGFPDRAAAVYRALLRLRPHDVVLEERARALEAEARALRATLTGVEENREVWVSGGPDTWDADELISTAQPWAEDEEAEQAGPTISEYFGRVLSWRPTEPTVLDDRVVAAAEPEVDMAEASGGESDIDRAELEAVEDYADTISPTPFVFGGEEGRRGEAGPFAFAPEPESEMEPLPPEREPEPAGPEAAGPEAAGPAVFEQEAPAAGDEVQQPFTFEPAAEEPQEAAAQPFAFEPEPEGAVEQGTARPFEFEADESAEAEPRPFDFEAEETDEAEPLPFVFESIEAEAADEEAEPLPFIFESMEYELDEESEPLPFVFESIETIELEEIQAGVDTGEEMATRIEPIGVAFDATEEDSSPPFLVEEPAATAGPAAPEPEAGQEREDVLFLQETEAVAEVSAQEGMGWDPTVALADVVPPTRPRTPAARPSAATPMPTPPPAPPPQRAAAPPEADEEDDDDLEMFRSWLQSLKK